MNADDLRKAIGDTESFLARASNTPQAQDATLWKAMDEEFMLIKGHVHAYQRVSSSGASVHVNDYENGRGAHYRHGAAYGQHHSDKGYENKHHLAAAHYETKTGKKMTDKEKEHFFAGYRNAQNAAKVNERAGGDKEKLKHERTKVMWM